MDKIARSLAEGETMNRRDWLKGAGAAGLVAAMPLEMNASSIEKPASAGKQAQLTTEIKRLKLRHTWTTTMSSSAYRDTVHTRYTKDGISGHGEGAPIIRYKEYPEQAKAAIDAIAAQIVAGDPWHFDRFLADVHQKLGEHQQAAMAAVDIAIMDWVGKALNVPLYKYFGLNPADAPVTTFSIGIDTPEITRQKTLEAAEYPVLKVKVGLKTDEETIAAVRSVTKKPLRVDANEGWTDRE